MCVCLDVCIKVFVYRAGQIKLSALRGGRTSAVQRNGYVAAVAVAPATVADVRVCTR